MTAHHFGMRRLVACTASLLLALPLASEAARQPAAKPSPTRQVAVAKKSVKPVEKVVKTFKAAKLAKASAPRRAVVAAAAAVAAAPAVPSIGEATGLHDAHDPLSLSTGAAVVMDASTHEIVYSKNAQAVLPIASITKLMTALVVLDSKASHDEVITITDEDRDTEKNTGSRLPIGTQLTRGELLKLALMSSENRAASALARNHPGGFDRFVAAMNERAARIGMTQTRYVDSTGLSNANRSSPLDLAKLVKVASDYEPIRRYSTQKQDTVDVSGRTLQYINSNALVRSGAWDITLQKTGYIREAGRCVVMEVEAAGRKMIMVLLDALTPSSRWADARKLREFTLRKTMGSRHPEADEVVPKAVGLVSTAPKS